MALFNKGNAQTSTKLFGYPVQTSIKGLPIPIVYGTNRISGNVVWTGDWKANPISSGKKGGGGKGGASQQYDYRSSIIIALCQGPIEAIGKIWVNNITYAVSGSVENFTISGTTHATQFGAGGAFANDVGVNYASGYSVSNNDYGSPGTATFAGTQKIRLVKVSSSPAAGQYSVNATTGIYTFNAADIGKTVELSYTWNQFSSTGGGPPAPNIGLTIIEGDIGQAPWSFLSSNHPSQAIGYSGIALAAAQDFDLGASGVVNNMLFEVFGLNIFGGGWYDAEMSSTFLDIISNPTYGVAGFDAGFVGSLTEFKNYTLANGLLCSPVIEGQTAALNYLRDMLRIANSEGFWSEGKLKTRTYGDTTAVGNGVTFTPDTAPEFDLDSTDFIVPLKIRRKSIKDADNRYIVEWTNRANNYNIEPLEEDDDASIARFGLRPAASVALHAITVHSVAQKVANVMKKRGVNLLNDYTLVLPASYCLLEPMDLVTVTVLELGLNKTPIRLLDKEEDEEGNYTFAAEDFPWGTAAPTVHPKQTTSRFGPGFFAPPGDVHTPLFYEPQPDQTQGVDEHLLLIALAGGQDWGGADIWVSTDGGNSYSLAGRQNGPATIGSLTADLADGADPDDSNTLAVNLTESGGALASYTKTQEDALLPLILVDDEILAYRTASLTGAFAYNVTHMRRGVFETPTQYHKSGTRFLYFDAGLFNWTYDVTNVGQLIYFKFTSFNRAGANEQALADVTPVAYRIKGPRLPYPWNANGTHSNLLDLSPAYDRSVPTVQQQYVSLQDGSKLAQIRLTGVMPPNVFSKKTIPPSIALASVATTGGTIPGGITVDVAVSAWGSDGLQTQLSHIVQVPIPIGTNTNKINMTIVFNGAQPGSGPAAVAYIGVPDDKKGLIANGNIAIGASTFIVSNVIEYTGLSCPDSRLSSAEIRATLEFHGGIFGGAVSAVGTNTLQFAGGTWTVNQLAGRYIILVSKANNSEIPLWESHVVSNTADTITLAEDPTGIIAPGDGVVVRSQPTSCTALVVTDTAWINGGPGQPGTGLDIDSCKGKLFWVIGGTGQDQRLPIASNTTTAVTLATPLTTLLDSTSICIIVDAAPTTVQPIPLAPGGIAYQVEMIVAVDNKASATFIVEVFLVDVFGDESDPIFSPFREVFQFGASGTPTPDGYFVLSIVSNHVSIDLANGRNQVLTLISTTQVTIDNILSGGGAPTPGDDWISLYVLQSGAGFFPTPAWDTAFGNDVKAQIIEGLPTNPRSVYHMTYHSDGKWHMDGFLTGQQN